MVPQTNPRPVLTCVLFGWPGTCVLFECQVRQPLTPAAARRVPQQLTGTPGLAMASGLAMLHALLCPTLLSMPFFQIAVPLFSLFLVRLTSPSKQDVRSCAKFGDGYQRCAVRS